MADNLIEVTDADFQQVTSGNEWVLVDFCAPWCGPCKMIGPILEQVATERSSLTIAKVNTDVNPLTPGRFGVRGIPYLVLFHNGQPVDTKTGAMAKDGFDQWLTQHMG